MGKKTELGKKPELGENTETKSRASHLIELFSSLNRFSSFKIGGLFLLYTLC